MNVYAETGSSLQQVGGECPDDWVVMNEQRPSADHTALDDGTWFLDTTAITRAAFKASREVAVAAIKVTSSLGRTFDGGEKDTDRMLKPITILQIKPEGTLQPWVLADNSAAMVALPEFLEVLEMAGLEQTRLWFQSN